MLEDENLRRETERTPDGAGTWEARRTAPDLKSRGLHGEFSKKVCSSAEHFPSLGHILHNAHQSFDGHPSIAKVGRQQQHK